MATRRIIDETTGTAASGDYVLTDSSTAGTKKVELVGMVDDAIDSALDDYEPADGSIDADMLAANAVTTDKLADNAITKPKLSAALRNALGNVLRGTGSGAVVTAHGTYAAPPLGLTVDGKSVQNGTPTPSAPVAIDSVESVAVKANSKNLLPHPPALINTDGGVTFTDNGDGSYTINGTATKNTYIYVTRKNSGFALPAGTYTLSARSADGTMPSDLFVGASRWNGSTNTNYGYTKGGNFTFTHDGTGEVQILVYVNKNYSVSNATVYPQLELGSSGTAYEPWTASSTTIDLQGHELRSLPDGTHDELRVDADGSVTLIQRVQLTTQAVTDGVSGTVGVDVMSSTGQITNGATVLYKLATPVTIPLGTVTLPALPAPDLTAWAVTDPSTTIALDYERDLTIAIDNLEAAIADLATS